MNSLHWEKPLTTEFAKWPERSRAEHPTTVDRNLLRPAQHTVWGTCATDTIFSVFHRNGADEWEAEKLAF